jgi:hypothetical protein
MKMAVACLFRESSHLLLGTSGSCSRRPAGDAGARKSSDACIALPTGKRLQDSRARISKTAAAPAVDLRSQSLVLRHILYIRAEEIARVRSGARGIRRVRRAGVLGSQNRCRPICGDARSCSSFRPRTRRFSTWVMGRNAETSSRETLRWQGHRRSGSAAFLIMFSATMKATETDGITFERIPFVLDLSTIQTSGGIPGKLR